MVSAEDVADPEAEGWEWVDGDGKGARSTDTREGVDRGGNCSRGGVGPSRYSAESNVTPEEVFSLSFIRASSRLFLWILLICVCGEWRRPSSESAALQ